MLHTLKKYKFDILICAILLIVSIIERLYTKYTFFYFGSKNDFPSLEAILIGFIYEVFKIIIVLFAFVRIFSGLKNIPKLKRYIVTALLSILILIVSWKLAQPSEVYSLKGFEKWVKKNVEIDKIQEWLISGEADKYIPSYYLDNFPNDLPYFMENFNRKFIIFNDQESERDKSIEFMWGGTFIGHWGIVIGMPTMNNTHGNKVTTHRAGKEYKLQIQPGVFIFDRKG